MRHRKMIASRMAWKIGRDGEAVRGDGTDGAVRKGAAAVGSVGGQWR